MMHADFLDDLIDLVPVMDIAFDSDVDCNQANGLNLPAIGINLRHRTDRWEALSQRMTSIGFDKLIRAPAVEGARVSEILIEALMGKPPCGIDDAPDDHLRLTRPAIGCFLSHLSIWRWMLTNNIERAILFEDDANPAPHFDAQRFHETVTANANGLSNVNQPGMVFLGRIIMHGLAEKPDTPGLARLYYFNGTFAYLITREACQYLLRHLLPMHSHIDHQISQLLIEKRDTFAAWHTEPSFFEPDWALGSDCFVPLADESAADRELGALFEKYRDTLVSDGRLPG